MPFSAIVSERAGKPAVPRRRRERTFTTPRSRYPLRLGTRLYEALTLACERAGMPTNTFVSTQLELACASSGDLAGLAEFQEEVGEGRVMVSLRLLPSLYKRVQTLARREDVSVNRLVQFVLVRALRQ